MNSFVGELSEPKAAAVFRPEEFFKILQQTFRVAEERSPGSVDRFYRIGVGTVRLRFAGPALLPLVTPALEHLAIGPRTVPALTVFLWDSQTTETVPVAPPWSMNDYLPRGEVRGYSDGDFKTSYHPASGILSMLHCRLGTGYYWLADARRFPRHERAAPLLQILSWWASERDRQVVHAAAVGDADGGVLLVGKGGSGKSTAALACLNAGMLYAGDDYCMIRAGDGDEHPQVHSLYNSGKLDMASARRFPRMKPALDHGDGMDAEKAIYFLHDGYREKMSAGFPLRAFLLPRVTGLAESSIKRVAPAACLLALAPSTIFQLNGAGRRAFAGLSRVVKQIPGYELRLGADISVVPDMIARLLLDRRRRRAAGEAVSLPELPRVRKECLRKE